MTAKHIYTKIKTTSHKNKDNLIQKMYEDNLKNEDDLKCEYELKNEDELKKEDNQKNEDHLRN